MRTIQIQIVGEADDLRVRQNWILAVTHKCLQPDVKPHLVFCLTARQATPGPELEHQISKLLNDMQWIWESYSKNTVTIGGAKCHINGNFRLLLQDDNITESHKTVLNGWIETTENVVGCPALRKKIECILVGFRVSYGDAILVTVTPNRCNSALLLYFFPAHE